MANKGRPRKIVTCSADLTKTHSALPPELLAFDTLPDSAHVRLPVVKGLYGCSESAVWRNAKAGNIPAPVKLTPNISAWNVGELRRALAGVSQ